MRIYIATIKEAIIFNISCLRTAYSIIDNYIDFHLGEMKIQLSSRVQFLVKIFSDTLTQKSTRIFSLMNITLKILYLKACCEQVFISQKRMRLTICPVWLQQCWLFDILVQIKLLSRKIQNYQNRKNGLKTKAWPTKFHLSSEFSKLCCT